MSSRHSIKSRSHINWLKGVFGLYNLQKGLYPFADRVIKAEHVNIVKNLEPCMSCVIEDILPAHASGNVCLQRNKARCNCTKKKSRHCATCSKIYDAIVIRHRFRDPCWVTDCSSWYTDHWQFAKCFLTTTHKGSNNTAADTDASGLLSIIINAEFFQSEIRCKIDLSNDYFSKVREIHNELMNNSSLDLTDQDLTRYFRSMITVLEDEKTLRHDPAAQAATLKLREILKDKFVIMTDEEECSIQSTLIAVKLANKQSEERIRKQTEESRNYLQQKTLKSTTGINEATKRAVDELTSTVATVFKETYEPEMKRLKLDIESRENRLKAIENEHQILQNKVAKLEASEERFWTRMGYMKQKEGTIIMGTLSSMPSITSTSQSDANAKLFLVKNSCFPRYEYAFENVLDILMRYKNVFNVSDNGELVPNRKMAFYLCKANDEADFPFEIEDIVSEHSGLETCPKGEITCLDDCLRKRDKSILSVFVLSTNLKELWESRYEQEATYLICARSGREARAISKQESVRSRGNILIIRKETAGQQIETYLVKTIFNDLNPVCEHLFKSMENAFFKREDEHIGNENTIATTVQSQRKGEGISKKYKIFSIENETLTQNLERERNKKKLLPEQNGKLEVEKTIESIKERTENRNCSTVTTRLKSRRVSDSRNRSGAHIKFEITGDVEHLKKTRRTEETETADGQKVRNGIRNYTNLTQRAAIEKSAEGRKKAASKKTPFLKHTTKTCSANLLKADEVEGLHPLLKLLKIKELKTINEQTKECLLEELIGVYNMSNVSVEEMPNIPQHGDKVALKTLSKHLFEQCPSVTGIGYRIGKLQINVEDIQNNDAAEKYTEIRQSLKEHNIHEYDIVPMSLKKYLTSGDEIRVAQKAGSFGCFAKMKDSEERNETPCGLLSKHVATTGVKRSEILAKKDGKFKTVGHILPESITNEGMDIAAATLSIPLQECETRFKSLRGKLLETGREKLTDTVRLRGNKVHMWGAVSKPGKGIITIPDYICKGMDHTLIQVEDIADGEQKVEKRFAQPGDSGAVTCADDPGQKVVHPVSMIMGCINDKEVEKDNKEEVKTKRGKYLTVPLQSGLDHLSRRTGKNFNLY